MTQSTTEKLPAVFWPADIQHRYRIAPQTRDRWEKIGNLPARDIYVGGKACGWHRETILAAECAPRPAA